ncbi:MAG: histidinol-phosphatase [Clostridia bacterium]|nr:histidinol-phosphatase [Clostridia bacterium]
MFKYETHLHTTPVSKCARVTVRQIMEFYKKVGFDGIFITNHFIDGNICLDIRNASYEERIRFYFSDYEEALKLQDEIGIKVFCGVESTYIDGTDFLIYGLDKEWFLAHPEIETMKMSQLLPYYMEHGALVIHAHPFREAGYIDHIRLFPRCVHGVEVVNASRTDFENDSAQKYAKQYNLLEFAGTDNHGFTYDYLGGMESETPVESVADFINKVKSGQMKVFAQKLHEPYCNAELHELDEFKSLES